MREVSPEQELKHMARSAVFMLGVAVLLIVPLAWLIPYEVDLSTKVDDVQGEWFVIDVTGGERRFATPVDISLRTGEGIRLGLDTTARLEVIKDGGALVYLSNGATWKLLESHRRGTAIEHIRNRADEYEIIIEQTAGTAIYDFSQAEPSFEQLNITLRFADTEIKPETPCFQATAPTDEAVSAVVEVPCRG
jgi:hypothetical protein